MKIKINYLRKKIRCADSQETVKFTTDKGLWKESYREKAWLLLRNHNNVRGLYLLSAGGIDCTTIDVRLACKAAVDALADNVIVMHNHPSGNPRPGRSDIEQTDRLRRALAMLDVRLTDHIVVGDGSFYSFATETTTEIN